MKRLTILIFLLLLATTLQAQRIHAYVTSGVALSQIEGDELKGFRKAGYVGGVGALAAISDNFRWGVSVEMLFSQRGSYSTTINPYIADISLNYIDIPLLLHYQDIYGGMLLGLGVTYGRLVEQPHFRGKLQHPNPSFLPDTADFAFLNDDVAVTADFRFTVWRGLQFNMRWQYSLLPVKRDWHFSEIRQGHWQTWSNNCYNHSLIFRLIWQF